MMPVSNISLAYEPEDRWPMTWANVI